MTQIARIAAVTMAWTLATAVPACGGPVDYSSGSESSSETETAETAETTEAGTEPEEIIPVLAAAPEESFDPFYCTDPDSIVCRALNGYITADPSCRYGTAEITQNEDGTAVCTVTLKENIRFSDGTEADIDDVIFGIYVECDPMYDGNGTIGTLPIEGLDAYRTGTSALCDCLIRAGRENEDFSRWTEKIQRAFWADYDEAGTAFAQEIIDYCIDHYAEEPEKYKDDASGAVKFAMETWGYGSDYTEGMTAGDFWNVLADFYGGDTAAVSEKESAGSSFAQLLSGLGDYSAGVSDGTGADCITGIQRADDHTLMIRMTTADFDVSELVFPVAALSSCGSETEYNFDNNMFGFTKGDLRAVRADAGKAPGCGPYSIERTDEDLIYLVRNTYSSEEVSCAERLQVVQIPEGEQLHALLGGTADIAEFPADDETLKKLDASGNDIKYIVSDSRYTDDGTEDAVSEEKVPYCLAYNSERVDAAAAEALQ